MRKGTSEAYLMDRDQYQAVQSFLAITETGDIPCVLRSLLVPPFSWGWLMSAPSWALPCPVLEWTRMSPQPPGHRVARTGRVAPMGLAATTPRFRAAQMVTAARTGSAAPPPRIRWQEKRRAVQTGCAARTGRAVGRLSRSQPLNWSAARMGFATPMGLAVLPSLSNQCCTTSQGFGPGWYYSCQFLLLAIRPSS